MVGIRQVPLDCAADDHRLVKFRDMRLWEITTREGVRYAAKHVPTRQRSDFRSRYTSRTPEWATADCICKVIEDSWLHDRRDA